MTRHNLIRMALIAAAAAFTACSSSTDAGVAAVSDARLISDIANASGDAIANDIAELTLNETFAGLPAPSADPASPGITVARTRTCFAAGQIQAACNATTTDSVQLTITMSGTISRTNATPSGADTMTVAVHRARSLTISGLSGTETTRIHNGFGGSSDTTHFSGTTSGTSRSRTMTNTALDSIQAIVFAVPRNSNPFPVSGRYVRNITGKITVTSGSDTGERTFTRRIVVTFPADGAGNVAISINGQNCSLNISTHVVSGCTI